jgi:hypothetical protein
MIPSFLSIGRSRAKIPVIRQCEEKAGQLINKPEWVCSSSVGRVIRMSMSPQSFFPLLSDTPVSAQDLISDSPPIASHYFHEQLRVNGKSYVVDFSGSSYIVRSGTYLVV